jgi:hypothetical protein
MRLISRSLAVGVAAVLLSPWACARPIVYAHSATVMAEYIGDTMAEAQLSYAPKSWWSFGLGHVELEGQESHPGHKVTYGRLNLLLKRWNRESAQANVFVWGGAGRTPTTEWLSTTAEPVPDDHDHGESVPGSVSFYQQTSGTTAWNGGAQIDYETRRIYTAIKTDYHESSAFWHRTDTLQLGFAPYAHDVDTLATWFLVSLSRNSGDDYENDQVAFLLRFFKKRTWVEGGVTTDGNLQARVMFSL